MRKIFIIGLIILLFWTANFLFLIETARRCNGGVPIPVGITDISYYLVCTFFFAGIPLAYGSTMRGLRDLGLITLFLGTCTLAVVICLGVLFSKSIWLYQHPKLWLIAQLDPEIIPLFTTWSFISAIGVTGLTVYTGISIRRLKERKFCEEYMFEFEKRA